jgi:hypothetical protein
MEVNQNIHEEESGRQIISYKKTNVNLNFIVKNLKNKAT